MSTPRSIGTPRHVPESRHPRGLIDTSVLIDLERIETADLPAEIAVAAITMAALNHPNIAAIYGLENGLVGLVGQVGRVGYRERVVALDEASPIAREVGAALEGTARRSDVG